MSSLIATLQARVGESLGTSDWVLIDQARIDAFGRATDDPDPMHMDPDWCRARSPFRTTIAFGFLTMSMLTRLMHGVMHWDVSSTAETDGYPLNYGFDRVRLVAPVPVGRRIRGHFRLLSVEEHRPGQWLQRTEATIEIEDEERPALVGEWLSVWVAPEGHGRLEARHAAPSDSA